MTNVFQQVDRTMFESCSPAAATVANLPSEDIVVLASGTPWRVPWELMMLGPFVSCGLVDGEVIRHVTVPAMIASAVRRGSPPSALLVASDYPPLPVFAAEMSLLDAASLVVQTGWELAIVIDHEPRAITARTVYRALLGAARPDALATGGASPARPCTRVPAPPSVAPQAPADFVGS